MIARDFFALPMWQVLEIVADAQDAGAECVSSPVGPGFTTALDGLRQCGLLAWVDVRDEDNLVLGNGYAITDAGRQLINVMRFARARADEELEAATQRTGGAK